MPRPGSARQDLSPYTCALKITGEDLKAVPIPEVVVTVSPDAASWKAINLRSVTLTRTAG